jgi:hypothetical protein
VSAKGSRRGKWFQRDKVFRRGHDSRLGIQLVLHHSAEDTFLALSVMILALLQPA